MEIISRDEYIRKTFLLHQGCSSEALRIKYWEILGKCLGYLEPPKIENNNIAIFQSISGEMMAFIQKRAPHIVKEGSGISVESTTVSTSKGEIKDAVTRGN